MTFSIVIPAFNGETYIENAILSAIKQTRKADEIIVYDDHSKDSTEAICEKYQTHIKYYLNEEGPSGFVNGWNKAVSLAGSEYIAILHQDDVLYPNFLEEAEKALNIYPDAFHLFSLCNYISNSGKIINNGEEAVKDHYKPGEIIFFTGQEYVRAYQKTFPGMIHLHRCPGVITHRLIFHSGCYYNPEAGHIADDDFFYRVGQYTSVVGIIKSLAAFRIHNESETGRIGDMNLVKRLSKDYLFQVIQWKNSDFIKDHNYRYFIDNAYKYSNRLLAYGFKAIKLGFIRESLKIMYHLNMEGYKNPRKTVGALTILASKVCLKS